MADIDILQPNDPVLKRITLRNDEQGVREARISTVLPEVYSGVERPDLKCELSLGYDGVGLRIDGHGVAGCADEFGFVVFVEQADGVARVLVYADINTDDPTHVIPLNDALIERRKE